MANIPIRDIPLEGTPTGSAYVVYDDGQMKKGKVESLADAVRPVASQGEAEAGVNNTKVMPPVRVKQAIASEVGVTLASKAQGDLANSAVQSVTAGIGVAVNSSAPTAPVVALTSAVQTSLGKADTALQPAAIGTSVQAYDADLQAIAALAASNDDFIQRKSGAWTNRTLAQVRAEIGSGAVYETRAAAAAATVGTLPSIQIIRHSTGLPPSPSVWNNVGASEPSHSEKILTADGKWLGLADKNIDTDMFGASSGDASPAFIRAFNYLQAGLGHSLELRGTHTIGARLPTLSRSTHIWGHGTYNSALFRNYNEATAYLGLITLSNDSGGGANGALVSDLVIRASAGSTGGCGISVFTNTTAAIGSVTINNVSISSDSTDAWYAPIYLSGNSATGAASGLRGLQMDQVQLFGGQAACLTASGIKFANITNCQFNTAGGTSGKVILSGTDDVFSSAFNISGSTFTDLIHLSKYDRGIITGSSVQSITNQDGNLVVVGTILGDVACSSGSVVVFGSVAGTVTGNVTVIATDKITMDALQVLGNRRTGWTAATGTATRTSFATGSVTLPQLAERVKALQDDLIAHGLIGT